MKILEVKQNTEDWLTLRNKSIGSSDANIVMGLSKYKTRLQLFNEKLGLSKPDDSDDFIKNKGHRLEEKMRSIIETVFDCTFKPLFVVSDTFDFLTASLDGYNLEKNCTWENKFCGQEDFEQVANGSMLMHYYPQVQHQLFVTGADYCIFSVIADHKESTNIDFKYKYCYIIVVPDANYINNLLLPELVSFWEFVKGKKPVEASDKDVIDLSENEELTNLLSEYHELVLQEKRLEEVKDRIFSIVKKGKANCNGFKISISKSEDKQVPDYEKACSLLGVDMVNYTKLQKGRITKRITLCE